MHNITSMFCVKLYLFMLIGSLTLLVSSNLINYKNYKIYVFLPKDERQSEIVRSIIDLPGVDAFTRYRRIYAPEYMIAPEVQPLVNSILKITNISHEILVDDIAKEYLLATQQTFRSSGRTLSPEVSKLISFTKYETYEGIQTYLSNLHTTYPDLISIFSIGKTYEGRSINVAKIGYKSNDAVKKPVILIDAGIHAREWIAPAFALYIIHSLVEKGDEYKDFVKYFDWFVIPVLNPDGYSYSHTHDRLWRKNRSPNYKSACVGKDINRNFDFHWNYTVDKCATDYAGEKSFSEMESRALRNLGYVLGDDIKAYITLHAYGPMLLYPWGYTEKLPFDYRELDTLGKLMTAPLDDSYVYGSSSRVLYTAPGGSDDWFKGVIGVNLSYTWELPAGGITGFEIPEYEILSVVENSFKGIIALGNYLMNKLNLV